MTLLGFSVLTFLQVSIFIRKILAAFSGQYWTRASYGDSSTLGLSPKDDIDDVAESATRCTAANVAKQLKVVRQTFSQVKLRT